MTPVYVHKKQQNFKIYAIYVQSQIVKYAMLIKNAKPVHSL